MITSVKETFMGKVATGKDQCTFWTYLICRVRAGGFPRYDLLRINNTTDRMERLGCELPLGHCRTILLSKEPSYKPPKCKR